MKFVCYVLLVIIVWLFASIHWVAAQNLSISQAIISGDGTSVFLATPNTAVNQLIWRYDIASGEYEALDLLASAPIAETEIYISLNDLSFDAKWLAFTSAAPFFASDWDAYDPNLLSPITYLFDLETNTFLLPTALFENETPRFSYTYETATAAARLSTDGRYLAFIGQERNSPNKPSAYLYDIQEDSLVQINAERQEHIVWNIDIDGGSRVVFVDELFPLTGANNRVQLYDIETGETQILFGADSANPQSFELEAGENFSTDGCCILFSASRESTVEPSFYHLETGLVSFPEALADFGDYEASQLFLWDISGDGRYVLLRIDSAAYLYDMQDETLSLIAEDAPIASMSDNAQYILLKDLSGAPRLFNRETSEEIVLSIP